ncbi:hypothetical protein [Methylobacterium durans]|uniref:Alpha/beta hydrolase n=1 Tax=Methylobacterium durans TaxID=2202825 RepID=A0A2U8WCY8_9HYPH|nr:hypothetical protein [Methylobacterium durans]AWN44035.1 hypothetical protein DK389_30455 [Methylobacterium durans]
MRSLLLAGAVLTAFATSANAWTQSILHPDHSYQSSIVTASPVAPRYMTSGPEQARRNAVIELPTAASSLSFTADAFARQPAHR